MPSAPHRNLLMFAELCGYKYARNVVFLTTIWDHAMNMSQVERREEALKERYWNVMIHHGATVSRFYVNERSGPKSPWAIVDETIQRRQLGKALCLQEEMVKFGKRLNETSAWKTLFQDLQTLIYQQNRTIKSLEGKVKGGQTGAEEELEKNSLSKRIALFLVKASGRREQAESRGQP